MLEMLSRSASLRCYVPRQNRTYTTKPSGLRAVPTLDDASLTTFRDNAFVPAVPSLLPRGSFSSIPAIPKWFDASSGTPSHPILHTAYLKKWGSTVVPLEITNEGGRFAQMHQPLQFFLECVIHPSWNQIRSANQL